MDGENAIVAKKQLHTELPPSAVPHISQLR